MPYRFVARSSLVVLAVLTNWAVPPVNAQEKENPIVARVKAALKDPGRPFTLVVRIQLKAGAGAKFEAAFAKAAQLTHQEKGNQAYDLNRDTQTPTTYLLYERWQNLSALDEHLKTPYIKKLLAEIEEMQAAPPELGIFLPAG